VLWRWVERTEQELLAQLERVPELTLDTGPERRESVQMVAVALQQARAGRDAETSSLPILEGRTDLRGLPFRRGAACKIDDRAARHLAETSSLLRGPESRRAEYPWGPEAIPGLQQVLMAEDESARDELVDRLATIEGGQASEALARRALYDLHPRVRQRALEALRQRPAEEYLGILLSGFEHPWPAVAEHAATAITSLRIEQAIPRLITLLDSPDPRAPFQKPQQGLFVREMVRVNHLSNCLMCHPPSLSGDQVRGRVPPKDQPLTPPSSGGYNGVETGVFVRADITYLKQDFSVPLVVKDAGHWPSRQRFDFLVRERPATRSERTAAAPADAGKPTEYQQAVLYALRELTGQDPGPSVADWKKHLRRKGLPGW
jgi:hypothetical protein